MQSHQGEDTTADEAFGTRRLVIRPAVPGDWATTEAFAGHPELAAFVRSPEQIRAGNTTMFTLVARATGEIVGQAGYQRFSDGPAPVEVSVWLAPGHWGQGLATEALHALVDRAFADGRIAVLTGAIRVTNARARRVLEKSGFQFRGAGMQQSAANGASYPVERFVLDRRNWASLKAWGADRPAAPHAA